MKTTRILLAAVSLSLGLWACGGKKDDATGGETPAAGKEGAAQVAAPKGLEAPASIVGYGGTADIQKLLTSAHGLATKAMPGGVPPADQLEAMIAQNLQGEYRLKDAKAFDLKKPIRFAFADPKAFGRDPSALLVGITGKDALVAALPELERKENDQGNAYSYMKFKGSKAPVFVNIIGDHAVFTRHAEIFGKHKDFLTALTKAEMPDHGGAYVELDHLLAIFGKEFDEGIAQAKREMTQAAKATPGGADQMKMVESMVDWLGAHSKQVDLIQITLATSDTGLRLNTQFTAKKGSDLAKLFGYAKGAPHDLLDTLPANAVAGMSSASGVDGLVELMSAMGDVIFASVVADEKLRADYGKAMADMMKATTGHFLIGVVDDPAGTGLTPVGLYGVKDGKAVRAAQDKLLDMSMSPPFVAMYEKSGVKMDIKKAAYEVGGVPVNTQTTSMTNMPPEAMMMMGMMQDLMTQHIAFGDKLGVLAYGASAKGVIEQYLGGKAPGGFAGKAGVKEALANSATNPSLFGYLEPLELAKKIKLGGMNPLAQMLSGVPSDGGLAFSLGGEGGALQAVLYVPVKTVQQGMAAFEKNKGAF